MAVNKIFIPTFISSVDYQPVRTLPRIYFYNGLKECEPYFIEHYTSTTGSVTASVETAFPYFDNYDGLIPTTGSRSLLFFNEPTPYGDTPTGSLYTTYWDKYVSLLYNPKTRLINCSAIIPLADYFEMELNDIVQWRGNFYHLRAINDYSLKDGTCNLQLLGPIIKDAVTPDEVDCTFSFNSIVENPSPTTTAAPTTTTLSPTTTVAPTTTIAPTTTLAPTTTTTLASYTINLLSVAGGGGSSRNGGGGGGAGGFTSESLSVTPTNSYTITVGGGGAAGYLSPGSNGSNSQLSPGGTLTYGGGGGGGGLQGTGVNGIDGASGGGSHRGGTVGYPIYGTQGTNGGQGSGVPALSPSNGGGGGGHSQAGFNSTNSGQNGGNGGGGTRWLDNFFYSGGGAGGANTGGVGGSGGGGIGGNFGLNGGAGAANRGGGAGGGGNGNEVGSNGGSGVVIIRYAGTPRGTGGIITQSGGFTFHKFTTSGTFTA